MLHNKTFTINLNEGKIVFQQCWLLGWLTFWVSENLLLLSSNSVLEKSYSQDKYMMEHVTLASVRRCEAHVLDPTFMMEHVSHLDYHFQF